MFIMFIMTYGGIGFVVVAVKTRNTWSIVGQMSHTCEYKERKRK